MTSAKQVHLKVETSVSLTGVSLRIDEGDVAPSHPLVVVNLLPKLHWYTPTMHDYLQYNQVQISW